MADFVPYDRVKETTTTTGAGTLTLAGAVTGYQSFSIVGNGNKCYYCIEAVNSAGSPTGDWEVGAGTYTVIGTTLSRDKIIASSSSNTAVNLSAGTKNVFLVAPAAVLVDPLPANGRLTLASGNPVYRPDNAAVPASTDTTAETVTFTLVHGWVSGTMVMPSSTVGGLTAQTTYYVNVASTTSVSFHTNVADALAGSSKVNLTASITASIIPLGIANSTIYYALNNGDRIAVPIGAGYGWQMRMFTELSLSLGTLTSGKNYDIFIWDNAGTLTLALGTAWTSDTARVSGAAGELTKLNGRYVNKFAEGLGMIAANAGLYVGTIRTVSTTTTEDSTWKRFVYNNDNKVISTLRVLDIVTASWTYAVATFRPANGNSVITLQAAIVNGIKECDIDWFAIGTVGAWSLVIGIGEDSTTANCATFNTVNTPNGGSSVLNPYSILEKSPEIGYHYYQWLESAGDSATATLYNFAGMSGAFPLSRSGMVGKWPC